MLLFFIDIFCMRHHMCYTGCYKSFCWIRYEVSKHKDPRSCVHIILLSYTIISYPSYILSVYQEEPNVDTLAVRPGKRLIKSHLGPNFFQKALRETRAKFIICMRNIKDNLVSYYHFYKSNAELGYYKGTFSEYFKLFEQKRIIYGDWFDFNLAWWALKANPNMLFIQFEDLIQDAEGQIKKIDAFLGINSSDDIINRVCQNVTFDEMKNNPAVNRSKYKHIANFMRRGKVGDWRCHFSKEESVTLDGLYAKKMEGSGLTFQFDLAVQRNGNNWVM